MQFLIIVNNLRDIYYFVLLIMIPKSSACLILGTVAYSTHIILRADSEYICDSFNAWLISRVPRPGRSNSFHKWTFLMPQDNHMHPMNVNYLLVTTAPFKFTKTIARESLEWEWHGVLYISYIRRIQVYAPTTCIRNVSHKHFLWTIRRFWCILFGDGTRPYKTVM